MLRKLKPLKQVIKEYSTRYKIVQKGYYGEEIKFFRKNIYSYGITYTEQKLFGKLIEVEKTYNNNYDWTNNEGHLFMDDWFESEKLIMPLDFDMFKI